MVQHDRQGGQPAAQRETTPPRLQRYKIVAAARDRYEGSLAQGFVLQLKAIDFSDQVMLFGAGMLAGLFVGFVICYQALYIAIRRRLKAFATAKAMGFGNGFVVGVVLVQAAAIGLAGYALGLALTAVVYPVLDGSTGLLIELTWARGARVPKNAPRRASMRLYAPRCRNFFAQRVDPPSPSLRRAKKQDAGWGYPWHPAFLVC